MLERFAEQGPKTGGPSFDAGLGAEMNLADLEQHVRQASSLRVHGYREVLVEREQVGLVVSDAQVSFAAEGLDRKPGQAFVVPVVDADVPRPAPP